MRTKMSGISLIDCPIFFKGELCRVVASLFFGVSLLTGCAATTPAGKSLDEKIESTMRDADVELGKGNREKAVALLDQVAKESPTSTAPWMKMANIWFETGNYPSSILAANEVLQRDPANQDAKALLVVGGLRVAASAVGELRPSAAIGASARTDAENLTNTLRSMLGEKVLVPAPAASEAKPINRVFRPKRSVPPSMHSRVGQGSPVSNGADPFKALK